MSTAPTADISLSGRIQAVGNAISRYLYAPAYATPQAAMRIGVALVLLVQAILLAPWVLELYGSNGLLQGGLNSYILDGILPAYIDWFGIAKHFHFSPDTGIVVVFALYVVALPFLLVGYKTRVAAIMVWACHFALMLNQGYRSSYGVDTFANLFLFYFMLTPVGAALSIDARHTLPRATWWNRFSLRLFQIHLAIAYCSSGILKSMGSQWRTGEAIWRALMIPQFHVFDLSWLAQVPYLALALTWGTLFLEIGYPVLLNWRVTRVWAGLALVSMHVGIAIIMGLWSFGAIMMVFTTAAFLVSPDSAQLQMVRPFIPRLKSLARFRYLRAPALGSETLGTLG